MSGECGSCETGQLRVVRGWDIADDTQCCSGVVDDPADVFEQDVGGFEFGAGPAPATAAAEGTHNQAHTTAAHNPSSNPQYARFSY